LFRWETEHAYHLLIERRIEFWILNVSCSLFVCEFRNVLVDYRQLYCITHNFHLHLLTVT